MNFVSPVNSSPVPQSVPFLYLENFACNHAVRFVYLLLEPHVLVPHVCPAV